MKYYSFQIHTKIPSSLEMVWEFFSTPSNLDKITPPGMGFKTITDIEGIRLHEGMIIEHELSLLPGLKMKWVSLISEYVEKEFFVDKQLEGPYAFWRHRHEFKVVDSEVLMTDKVDYAIGWGIFGKLAHRVFVKKKLEEIFEFRTKMIVEHFYNSRS